MLLSIINTFLLPRPKKSFKETCKFTESQNNKMWRAGRSHKIANKKKKKTKNGTPKIKDSVDLVCLRKLWESLILLIVTKNNLYTYWNFYSLLQVTWNFFNFHCYFYYQKLRVHERIITSLEYRIDSPQQQIIFENAHQDILIAFCWHIVLCYYQNIAVLYFVPFFNHHVLTTRRNKLQMWAPL